MKKIKTKIKSGVRVKNVTIGAAIIVGSGVILGTLLTIIFKG
ncbi:MAG: hypothetical protein AAB358_03705 [Patescibacteria group bacterium]